MFGVLLISPKNIYFLKEKPNMWRDFSEKSLNFREIKDMLDKRVKIDPKNPDDENKRDPESNKEVIKKLIGGPSNDDVDTLLKQRKNKVGKT